MAVNDHTSLLEKVRCHWQTHTAVGRHVPVWFLLHVATRTCEPSLMELEKKVFQFFKFTAMLDLFLIVKNTLTQSRQEDAAQRITGMLGCCSN